MSTVTNVLILGVRYITKGTDLRASRAYVRWGSRTASARRDRSARPVVWRGASWRLSIRFERSRRHGLSPHTEDRRYVVWKTSRDGSRSEGIFTFLLMWCLLLQCSAANIFVIWIIYVLYLLCSALQFNLSYFKTYYYIIFAINLLLKVVSSNEKSLLGHFIIASSEIVYHLNIRSSTGYFSSC